MPFFFIRFVGGTLLFQKLTFYSKPDIFGNTGVNFTNYIAFGFIKVALKIALAHSERDLSSVYSFKHKTINC